ncbi:MAG: HK97 family phage prohead protease [Armatimonadetes bacterium]|nr:HK97 family phage prohead protease [Armatimonadota bacterium]
MKTRVTPSAVEVLDLGGRRLRALISAETLDRENEVLVAAGAELDNYRRNPVVLWAHDSHLPPIGRAVEVRSEPGVGVWADNEFADTPFAREIFELYQGGYLRAFSVGFRPLEIARQARRDGAKGLTVLRWELLEQSAVAVPANPDALVAASESGNRAAAWLLKTYYAPVEDGALLERAGLDSPDPAWPALAAAVCRYYGARGGLRLAEPERERLELLLRGLYAQRGLSWPEVEPGAPPSPHTTRFHHDEPLRFEEREIDELLALLRGRSRALRNIARKRRRRGEPLPETDPLHEVLADLHEVAGGDAPGAPSGPSAGSIRHLLDELKADLSALAREREAALAAALDDLRRGAIGGALTHR